MTEAEKYAAQHSVPENMRDLLQQIVEDGYVYQLGAEITQDIVHEIAPEVQPIMDRQPEIDLEPER